MKKHLIYLCACVCALMFSGCSEFNLNNFVEPCTTWGADTQEVLNEMTSKGFKQDGDLETLSGSIMRYHYRSKKNNEITTYCDFQKSKLVSSGVYFNKSTTGVSFSELRAFLAERYGMPQTEGGEFSENTSYAFFYSKDARTVILLEQTTYKNVVANHVQYTENK